MQIFIKTLGGKIIQIDVLLSDSIEKIKAIIQDKKGIIPERQILVYLGRRLQNDKIFADYNIRAESTIHLIIKSGEFCYIVYDEGKKLKIEGFNDCRSNTLFLKEEIEKKLGIETKYQELIVDGKIMEDNEKLINYKTSDGKEIQLRERDFGVGFQFPYRISPGGI
jgi:ubiquitin